MLKRTGVTVLGWLLVLAGLAALVLPGPGLLMLFAGLAVLSQEYAWAERRVEPIKVAAFRAAAEGVQSWPRIVLSALGACWLFGFGIVWIVRPDAPEWWPVHESWWLIGGSATGLTLIASGALAVALLVYSFRRFRSVE